MEITKDLLRERRACCDGFGWFIAKFPQGSTYSEVQKALRAEKRYDDARWLIEHVYASLFKQPEKIASVVKDEVADALADTKDSPNSATGYSSTAASSGDYSTAASSGYSSTAASSGDYSTAEAKGEQTVAMVAGLNGRARAGEKGAFALAWLDGEQLRIAVGVVGEAGIKADTWYRVEDGQLQEVL